jgi:hypothetical protein
MSMEDAFLAVFETTRRGRDAQQRSTPRRPGGPSRSLSTASTSRTTHNIIGSKLSNTEKIERLGELLNKCALTSSAPAARRRDPDRPHRQPHRQPRRREARKFVRGRADVPERECTATPPRRPCCAGSSRRS